MVVVCRRAGVVMNADAERIIIKVDADNARREQLFRDPGRPLRAAEVPPLQPEHHHQPAAAGQGRRARREGPDPLRRPRSNKGELAMGRNILAAFVPWRGYNYEDAIILSERLVKTSAFNSIYIVEETIEARETKLGPEEITRDIPSVSETALKNLDESGIVRIGAKVKPGEILVGKVSPRAKRSCPPRRSCCAPSSASRPRRSRIPPSTAPGVEGTVIDVKVFTRRGQKKDKRAEEIDRLEAAKMERNFADEKKILLAEKFQRSPGCCARKSWPRRSSTTRPSTRRAPHPGQGPGGDGRVVPPGSEEHIGDEGRALVSEVEKKVRLHIEALKQEIQEKIEQMKRGDEFAPASSRSSRCSSPSTARYRWATRWRAATATRAWSPASCPWRTCPSWPTGATSTWCSTRSACPRA